MNKRKKGKIIANNQVFSETEFAETGDITYDCPGRDYGNYKWDNKKKKWVKSKM